MLFLTRNGIFVCMHVCVCVHVYANMHVSYMWVCMYVCMCMRVCKEARGQCQMSCSIVLQLILRQCLFLNQISSLKWEEVSRSPTQIYPTTCCFLCGCLEIKLRSSCLYRKYSTDWVIILVLRILFLLIYFWLYQYFLKFFNLNWDTKELVLYLCMYSLYPVSLIKKSEILIPKLF